MLNIQTLPYTVFRTIIRSVAGRGLGLQRIPIIDELYRWAFRKLVPRQPMVVEVHGCKLVVNPADKTLRDSMLMFGTHEDFETHVLMDCLRPGMTFLDIGANVGYYTVIGASKVGPSGRVFSYEPDNLNYSFLERSVQANGFMNVRLIKQALSDTTGTATFYLSDHLGSHSLAAPDDCRAKTTVELTRLDDDDDLMQGGVQVIKMDAQGAEYKIIKGGMNLLRKWMPVIMMEFEQHCQAAMDTSPEEFAGLFEELGYSITILDAENRRTMPATASELVVISGQRPYLNVLLKKA